MEGEPIIADAREALTALTEALSGYKASFGSDIEKAKAEWDEIVDGFYGQDLNEGLSQTRALGEINRFMAPSDIAVGSAGSLPGDMQRLWRSGDPCTYTWNTAFPTWGMR
jgi:3D-(3,5/4)-trihydroxycyclohexane-1,2-dione acylhydrolase (decyclizing)